MHLIHLLAHRLNLLLCGLQLWRLVAVFHELRINGLGKAFGHLLSARPVHVLDEQVTGNSPQLWVALQELRHRFQRLLPLGGVPRACGHDHIVLAYCWVVNLVDCDALLVNDPLDGFLLHRVNLGHVSLAVFANDPSNPLGIVNLGNQVHQLAGHIAHRTG